MTISLRAMAVIDTILGDSGNDRLEGGSGNDTLYGEDGADTLQGGFGADRLAGGKGADVYVFARGDGSDTIASASADEAAGDEVHLGAGIAAGDLRFFRLANGDLLMRIADVQDSILFEGWFSAGPNVTALRLDDDSLMTADQMSALAADAYGGTSGDDVLVGTREDDRIEGYAGDDSLDGAGGNDRLIGGDGVDTYLFGWNSLGHDVAVESGEGSSFVALTDDTRLTDLRHQQMGDDLILSLRGGSSVDGATLTLQDYFTSPHVWTILDTDNTAINVADWLLLPEPVVDIAQLQADFLSAVRAQWVNDVLSNTDDSHRGLYTRVDETTYSAVSITQFGTHLKTQHFTVVDTAADSAVIQRQYNNFTDFYTRVDVSSPSSSTDTPTDTSTHYTPNTPDTASTYEARFYPIGSYFSIAIDYWRGGYSEVYDSYNELIGIVVYSVPPVEPVPGVNIIQQYWQDTTTIDTHIERIQGGDSDNVIKGFKNGNGYQYNDGTGQSDVSSWRNEISLIDGGGGDDILHASGRVRPGYEMYYFADNAANIGGFVYGNTGNDVLYGNHARDTLVGGDGDDILDGRFSQDTYIMLAGESGFDTIWDTGTQLWQIGVFRSDDVTSYRYRDGQLDPQPIAQDTLVLVGINPENVVFTWGQRMAEGIRERWPGEEADAVYNRTMHATLTMHWTNGGVEIVLPNSTDLPGMGLERIQFGNGSVLTMAELIALAGSVPNLDPQDLDDIIVGQSSHDVIYGDGGNDTLDGGDGDDFLNGGTGDDTLIGGNGDDTVEGGSGNDMLDGGDGDDFLDGGIGDDTLMGGSGDDTFVGGDGNDTLIGGAGNDTYRFDRGAGQDTIDNYDITHGKIDTVVVEYGVTVDDVHVGRSGNDLVLTIIGTTDTLMILNYLENGGITPYAVERIRFDEDYITWDLPTILMLLESNDVPDSNQTPVLAAALLDQEATQGNAFSYTVDANAFVDSDAGDMLTYSATLANGDPLPAWLSFDAQALVFSGTPDTPSIFSVSLAATDTGNLTASDIFDIQVNAQGVLLEGTSGADVLNGGSGDDIINGLAGNDILNGNAGNDRLNGGAGNDTMTGGTGDDIYVVNSVLDIVIENFDEGTDTVRSSIAYILGANVEHLNLTGTNAIDGTGNALDNHLIGNAADNTLTGHAGNDRLNGHEGADTLIGGSGDDIYIVDNLGDVVIEFADEGIDRVRSSVSYTLGSHVEELVLTGSSAINGSGNELGNNLVGNDASNILIGEAGNDRLNGRGGADILIGGAGNDVYILGRDYGTDTVIENDATTGNNDVVRFLPGISANQIWFQQVGDNLEVSIIGTSDKLVISNWYLGLANRIERFRTSDGLLLQDNQVEDLVDVMSGFAVPDIGQTILPDDYAAVLDPVITSLWL